MNSQLLIALPCHVGATCHAVVPRLRDEAEPRGCERAAQLFPERISAIRSFNHFLKLLTDYRSVEAIDGDAKPERVCV